MYSTQAASLATRLVSLLISPQNENQKSGTRVCYVLNENMIYDDLTSSVLDMEGED